VIEMANELERTYVIPLRRGFVNTPRYKRTNKAVKVLRLFLEKHMKTETVKIGPVLNDLLWVNGIKNPPGKVVVNATKDKEGIVRVELQGHTYVDFKQQGKTTKSTTFKEKLQEKLQTKNKDEPSEEKAEKTAKTKEEKTSTETKTEDKKEVEEATQEVEKEDSLDEKKEE
jgi:large subunit ribosomal protein L31e